MFISGAEDKHGYLWDRHYGVCLAKFPHIDVVNSVAFNPRDPEMLVTTSDDYTVKVWRSRSKVKELGLEDRNFPQVVSHQLNTMKVQVQFHDGLHGICSGQSGNGAGFFHSASVFLCQLSCYECSALIFHQGLAQYATLAPHM